MLERDVARASDERLECAGWFLVKTSQDKSTRRHLAGLPDRIAVRRNHVLFIEYKATGAGLRKEQVRFAANVAPHCGDNVRYLVVYHPDQLPYWTVGEVK